MTLQQGYKQFEGEKKQQKDQTKNFSSSFFILCMDGTAAALAQNVLNLDVPSTVQNNYMKS